MWLLKTHSHTSKRPGYEARKTQRKATEGDADPITRLTTVTYLPSIAGVAGGSETKMELSMAKQTTERGAMARQTVVESQYNKTTSIAIIRYDEWKGYVGRPAVRGWRGRRQGENYANTKNRKHANAKNRKYANTKNQTVLCLE